MRGMGIEGIQEAMRANEELIAGVKPTGGLGQAVLFIVTGGHRYAMAITHVVSGALRASHRMEVDVEDNRARGMIFIDPDSVNPQGNRPFEYGPEEEARGGEHAFYQRTVDEEIIPNLIDRAMEFIV